MGMSYAYRMSMTPHEKGLETKRRNAAIRAQADAVVAKRMALADKIVMAVVDEIALSIVRPGPKPEERECYVMAQELRDHSSPLKDLVAAILKVDEDER